MLMGWSAGIWPSNSGSIPRRFARTGGAYRLDITDPAAGHFDRPDFQRVRIDPVVNLAPLARLRRPVFLNKPFTFPLGFDPGAVDQQVQRTGTGRYGMATFRPLGRRDKVLKSGPIYPRMAQSSPANRRENSPPDCFLTLLISSKLATSPPRHGHSDQWRFHGSICRNGSPNSAFNVRHAWIAASVNVAGRPRFPLGSASQTVSGSNQICRDPRCFRAALAIGLEPMAPQWLDRRASSSCGRSGVWACS